MILTATGGWRDGIVPASTRLQSICTSECSRYSACPAGFSCYESHCIPEGQKEEDEACEAPWDCKSHQCGTSMVSVLRRAAAVAQDPTKPELAQPELTCLPARSVE
jgi:hypothetical protein